MNILIMVLLMTSVCFADYGTDNTLGEVTVVIPPQVRSRVDNDGFDLVRGLDVSMEDIEAYLDNKTGVIEVHPKNTIKSVKISCHDGYRLEGRVYSRKTGNNAETGLSFYIDESLTDAELKCVKED